MNNKTSIDIQPARALFATEPSFSGSGNIFYSLEWINVLEETFGFDILAAPIRKGRWFIFAKIEDIVGI